MTSNRFLSSLLLACALVASAVGAAQAGASGWYETQGARIRIVAEPPLTGETELRAALQIELEPGWKTYWREPGASGIPPQVTFSGETIDGVEIHFPVPVRVDEGDTSWAGYTSPVSLPLTLELAEGPLPASLEASIFLGVCQDICIPVMADLEVPLSGATNTMQSMVIDAAFAALASESSGDLAVDGIRWTEAEELEIALSGTASAGATDIFLAAGPEHGFKPPYPADTNGARSVFRAEPLFDPAEAGAFAITIAVRAGAETIETTRSVPGG